MTDFRKHSLVLSAVLFMVTGCRFSEVELSDCWPMCDAGPDESGLEVLLVYATPNTLALDWKSDMLPEDRGQVEVLLEASGSSVQWTNASDPGLSTRDATTVLGLLADTEYEIEVRGITANGSIWMATGTHRTTPEPSASLTVFAESAEGLTYQGFSREGDVPAVHSGNTALWFDTESLQGGSPRVSGFSVPQENMSFSGDPFLEVWIRVLPSQVLPGVTLQLFTNEQVFMHSTQTVPSADQWHQWQIPLSTFLDAAGNHPLAEGTMLRGFGLDAAWSISATVVVDDISVRF